MSKKILVTGGNAGIGLALCKLLVSKHGCHVFLGSRSPAKGEAAVASIVEAHPEAVGNIEAVSIDVSDDASVAAAAATLEERGVKLYALVNNAGAGLAHGDVGGVPGLMNVNYYGPKRVTEAFVRLIAGDGRIVNTSSGAASMWLRGQDAATKALYTNPQLTFAELDANVKANVAAGGGAMGGYGLSKAALTALTGIHARTYPTLKVVSLSPGFIATAMTAGFGAKLTPEQGCVSAIKCLFGDVTSGCYYGSDGLRSPLTCTRDPGTPEYQGEPEPDPARYNK